MNNQEALLEHFKNAALDSTFVEDSALEVYYKSHKTCLGDISLHATFDEIRRLSTIEFNEFLREMINFEQGIPQGQIEAAGNYYVRGAAYLYSDPDVQRALSGAVSRTMIRLLGDVLTGGIAEEFLQQWGEQSLSDIDENLGDITDPTAATALDAFVKGTLENYDEFYTTYCSDGEEKDDSEAVRRRGDVELTFRIIGFGRQVFDAFDGARDWSMVVPSLTILDGMLCELANSPYFRGRLLHNNTSTKRPRSETKLGVATAKRQRKK